MCSRRRLAVWWVLLCVNLGYCAFSWDTQGFSIVLHLTSLFCMELLLLRALVRASYIFCARNPPERSSCEIFRRDRRKMRRNFGEIFADFRPSISRENGRKQFHKKSSTFSTVHQIKFFHCCNSGGLGAQTFWSFHLPCKPIPWRLANRNL